MKLSTTAFWLQLSFSIVLIQLLLWNIWSKQGASRYWILLSVTLLHSSLLSDSGTRGSLGNREVELSFTMPGMHEVSGDENWLLFFMLKVYDSVQSPVVWLYFMLLYCIEWCIPVKLWIPFPANGFLIELRLDFDKFFKEKHIFLFIKLTPWFWFCLSFYWLLLIFKKLGIDSYILSDCFLFLDF